MLMSDKPLLNYNIFVAEDDYLLAIVMEEILGDAGATVVGPAPNIAKAMSVIGQSRRIDAALLDVNLGGELVYPVADLLRERQVPIILTTGYDSTSLDPAYTEISICEKPFEPQELVEKLVQLIPQN
jgi:DNA-binding response OmpR family regulator